jgi:CBS domain-containing protein
MTGPTAPARIASLSVRDAMHGGVITCHRDTPLSEVAETMAQEHVHCVVVEAGSGENAPLWGVVSDLDLVAAATVRELDQQTAGGSAATPVLMIAPEETLERAAQLMTEHASAHLVVVDGKNILPIGILSTLDIAAALGDGG